MEGTTPFFKDRYIGSSILNHSKLFLSIEYSQTVSSFGKRETIPRVSLLSSLREKEESRCNLERETKISQRYVQQISRLHGGGIQG